MLRSFWTAICLAALAGNVSSGPTGAKAAENRAGAEASEENILALENADAAIRPFLRDYCYRCHGEEEHEGDLRLDTLSVDVGSDDGRETWTKVAEAIEFRDMPPKEAPQPDGARREAVIREISAAAAITSGATASGRTGPVALRRMNRVEYENTVHDLLGIDAPLAQMLPADGTVRGFDNVAGGLSISSVLMERYMEAADVAFDAVIRRIKPLPPETRRSVMVENEDNRDSIEKNKGGVIEAEASFVKFRPGWPPVRVDEAHPIEDGVYRCRIAAWPYQPQGRTLVVAVYVGPLFGAGERRMMGMYDVTGTSDDPRIIEFTTRMEENDAVHIVPWIYPSVPGWVDEPKPGVAVQWVETHGPLDQAWPSEAQQRLFGDLPMIEDRPVWMRHRKNVREHVVDSEHPREDAERILREFIPRAFRRPVEPSTMRPFVKLVHDRLDSGRTFEQAMRAGITAVLCSPQFLLLSQEMAVDDYTVASRLSYFLWSSMPDDELMRLAADGKLREPQVLHDQVERLLEDARSERFVDNFIGQWLDQREIEVTTPDKKQYPEFDDLLQESMLGETRGFFRHLLDNDLSVVNFIDSDFTLLNERLAAHYGIEGVAGHERFRLVELPEDSIRGGVLTQASVLKVTANGTTTSPVLRGAWVLDRLLGQTAPPPPAGVPAVEPDIRGATTIREQLDQHRSVDSCARCHVRIDPPGFALEQFDAIGGQRDWYRSLGEGKPVKGTQYKIGREVDASGELADGRSFADFPEFRAHLLSESDQIARAIAQKLLTYGTGRPIDTADRLTMDSVVEAAKENDLGLRSMIHAVVASEAFTRP